jgi:hypothetical protein
VSGGLRFALETPGRWVYCGWARLSPAEARRSGWARQKTNTEILDFVQNDDLEGNDDLEDGKVQNDGLEGNDEFEGNDDLEDGKWRIEDQMMSAWVGRFSAGAMAVALLLAAGCSGSTATSDQGAGATASPAGPAQTITAKTAFGKIYPSARAWAADAEFLTEKPDDLAGFKNEQGKAAMWEAGFGSQSLHQYKVYTYAVATVLPDVHRGVSANLALPWHGDTRDAMSVDLSLFSVDSDAAYQAAATEAAPWLAKNPDKKLSLVLGRTFKFGGPVWLVTWGDVKQGGYAVFVDASSGKVYKSK